VRDAMEQAWSDVVETACRSVTDGLVVGTSGNVSARVGDLVLITPSGVPYHRLGPGDAVAVDLEGRPVRGQLAPSSELPMHLAVYRETPARAIVHTHAPHATAASTVVDRLPDVHYIAAAMGGGIEVAEYALYGTEELARSVLKALTDRTGCLMRNHGTLVYGDSLEQAYDNTLQLEWMCRVWLLAQPVATDGAGADRPLHTVSRQDMAQVLAKLKDYGRR
jgi:L-fuculose-phosphate aldolase